MGRFYADESISVSATPATLDRDLLDNVSGSRAERAVIQTKSEAVLLRFGNTPTSTLSHLIPENSSAIIEGYDNLIQATFVTQSGDSGTIFANYEN